jgi:hypothetical protein
MTMTTTTAPCSISAVVRASHRIRAARALRLRDADAEARLLAAFSAAAAAGCFNALVAAADAESVDLIDITDIVAAVSPRTRAALLRLFAAAPLLHPENAPPVKVVSDLDNTAVETSAAAASVYTPGDWIPGFLPLISALRASGDGGAAAATSVTFLSARPNAVEVFSLMRIAASLRGSGVEEFPFSFASGSLAGAAAMAVGARRRAFREFAAGKLRRWRALRDVYPASRFVFLGDDTQGDWLFALWLVRSGAAHFAFIRRAVASARDSAGPGGPLWPGTASEAAEAAASPRIAYVSSWYEAIAHAPQRVLPDHLRAAAAEACVRAHDAAVASGRFCGYANAQRAAEDADFLNRFLRR